MQVKKLVIDIQGTELLEEEKPLIAHKNTGGVILFTKNYKNKSQLIKLIKDIRSASTNELLIMVDQEGGRIWRFDNEDFTKIQSAEYFGNLYNDNPEQALKEAKESGFIMGKELKDCDIDISLAPVLDLTGISEVIRDRAFHNAPEVVTKLATAFIAGMHESGIKCCGKHFPGHGGCVADTHFKQAVDDRSLQEIEELDLIPFKNLLPKLDFMLVSHVIYKNVCDQKAAFSKFWLQDILRNKLNFNKPIITDCLSMEAANIGDYVTRVQNSFSAGCNYAILSQVGAAEQEKALNSF